MSLKSKIPIKQYGKYEFVWWNQADNIELYRILLDYLI